MSTQRQIGPVTVETVVVLANESPEAFEALARAYVQHFGSRHGVESGIIQELTATFRRIRRATSLETDLLGKGLDKQPPDNEIGRTASAFRDAADSTQLGLLHRYEAHLQLTFHRRLRNLLQRKNMKLQNEPDYVLKNQRTSPVDPMSPKRSTIPCRPVSRPRRPALIR